MSNYKARRRAILAEGKAERMRAYAEDIGRASDRREQQLLREMAAVRFEAEMVPYRAKSAEWSQQPLAPANSPVRDVADVRPRMLAKRLKLDSRISTERGATYLHDYLQREVARDLADAILKAGLVHVDVAADRGARAGVYEGVLTYDWCVLVSAVPLRKPSGA